MKSGITFIMILLVYVGCKDVNINSVVLRQDQYYTEEQGEAELARLESMYKNNGIDLLGTSTITDSGTSVIKLKVQ